MWVFTELGFFSAVRYNEATDPKSKTKGKLAKNAPVKVMVRARVYQDLQNLVELYDGTNVLHATEPLEILEWKGRDYPYRVIMLRETWADLLELIAGDIKYTNFKDHIKKVQGSARSGIYSGVWSVMYDAEFKLDPKPSTTQRNIDYFGDDTFGMGYGRSLDPRGTGDIIPHGERQFWAGAPSRAKVTVKKRTPARPKTGKKALHKAALEDGFDNSEIIKGAGVCGVKISCSQCHALVVNGLGTHEHGCPNKKSRRLAEVECGTCGEQMKRVSQLKSHVCP